MKNLKKYFKKIKEITTSSNIFMFLGVLLIFFIAFRPPTDPDMGWHLADGEYLMSHHLQVATHDIFSYTMPNFPLIMHEWLTDIAMFAIQKYAGLLTLSIIFAMITAGAFFLAAFGVRARKEYKIIAAILGMIASIPILGVRPQILSLLGLALVIFIIFRFRENTQTRLIYALPPFFLLWANVHGGFFAGLAFIGLFLGLETGKLVVAFILQKIKKWPKLVLAGGRIARNSLELSSVKKLAAIYFISIAATFINPYGWRIYVEIFTTIFDSYAKANIGEWLPVTVANPMSFQFIIYLALLGILLLMSLRNVDYTYLTMAAIFLYLGFESWRNMPVFLIISTPLWVTIVESLVGTELLKLVQKKWFLIIVLAAVAVTANQQVQATAPIANSIDKLAEVGNYPLGAVRYLKANPIEGNMFNEYNWGGFLIWQYPEKKVFIDGRMPSWRIGSQRIFEEFNDAMSFNDGWDKTFAKYDVKFALVYDNPLNQAMFVSIGWKKDYGDGLAAVYENTGAGS